MNQKRCPRCKKTYVHKIISFFERDGKIKQTCFCGQEDTLAMGLKGEHRVCQHYRGGGLFIGCDCGGSLASKQFGKVWIPKDEE